MEAVIIISLVFLYVITFKVSLKAVQKYLEILKELHEYEENMTKLIRYLLYCFIPIVNIFLVFKITKKIQNLRLEIEREHLRLLNLRRTYWDVKKEETKGFGMYGGLKLNI